MLEKFKNWFKSKKQNNDINKYPSPVSAILNFSMLEDGQTIIETKWALSDEKHAQIIAELIFLVTEGGFVNEIAQILQEYAKQDEKNVQFVYNTLTYWDRLHKEKKEAEQEILNKERDEPLISPDQYMNLPVNNSKDEDEE